MSSEVPKIAFTGAFKGAKTEKLREIVQKLGAGAAYDSKEAEKNDDWNLLVVAGKRHAKKLLEKTLEKGITVVGESWIEEVQAEGELLPYEDHLYEPQ